MAHSLVSDVRNALTPEGSSTDASTAAGLSDAQLEDAINEADQIVNLYLTRYTIPTQEVEVLSGDPPVTTLVPVAVAPVRYWSRNVAAWLATLTFKRNKDVPEDDPVRLRYNMTMGLLASVRDGVTDLPFEEADPLSGDAIVVNQYSGTLFGPEDFGLSHHNRRTSFHVWPGGT